MRHVEAALDRSIAPAATELGPSRGRRTRLALAAGFALACLAPRAAADVLIVGPGNYASIQSAVDAAVDGDLILVRSTSHTSVTIDGKGLVLVADVGKQPLVNGLLRVQNLQPDQDVLVAGISATGSKSMALELRSNLGSVRVLGGTFKGAAGNNVYGSPDYHPDGYSAALVTKSADVAFSRTVFLGGGGADVPDWWIYYPTGDGAGAVFVRDSHAAFYNCEASGGWGGSCYDVHNYDGGTGGPGIETPDAFLFLSGCTLTGGNGGYGGDEGALSPAGWGGDGGDGLLLDGAPQAEAQLLDNTLTGGAGGAPGCCSGSYPGQPGVPIAVIGGGTVNQIPDVARSLQISWPQHEQTQATLTFQGQPQDRANAFISWGTSFQFSTPFQGTVLTSTPLVRRLYMGTIDATGTLQAQLSLPQLAPGVEHQTWTVQGLFIDPSGQITLADCSALIILDSAF